MHSPRVLLADPDPRAWGDLADRLEAAGFEVALETASDRLESRLGEERFDVLLAELQMLGRRVLDVARSSPGRPEVMLLDTYGDEGDGAAAMRAGAFDVLPRPASTEQCLLGVQRALEARSVENENRRLRRETNEGRGLGHVVTREPRMQRALDLVRTVADTRVTLLIEGESGTGKTMVARALHDASPRAEKPFVVVNCGALPDALLESELFGHVKGAFTGAVADRVGRFQAADGGTLFLDEINSASLDLQVKLLRAIESGEFEPLGGLRTVTVDVRIVAASNRSLTEEVAAERFRDDLYWRLKVVAVELPPLRERPADVVDLAGRFVASAAADHGRDEKELSSEALAALLGHPWPGNVRELRHALERAVLVAPGAMIEIEHLPPELSAGVNAPSSAPGARLRPSLSALPARSDAGPGPMLPPSGVQAPRPAESGHFDAVELGPLKEMLAGPERRFIERALEATDGSRKRAAALLDINRGTLFNKMRRYRLMSSPPRRDARLGQDTNDR